jgi:hypothetical protein
MSKKLGEKLAFSGILKGTEEKKLNPYHIETSQIPNSENITFAVWICSFYLYILNLHITQLTYLDFCIIRFKSFSSELFWKHFCNPLKEFPIVDNVSRYFLLTLKPKCPR